MGLAIVPLRGALGQDRIGSDITVKEHTIVDLPSFLWLWRFAAWSMGLSLTAYGLLAISGLILWSDRRRQQPRPPGLAPPAPSLRDQPLSFGVVFANYWSNWHPGPLRESGSFLAFASWVSCRAPSSDLCLEWLADWAETAPDAADSYHQ